MSEFKFKPGDRVRVVEGSEGDHVRVGANALVLTAEANGTTLAWGTKTDAFTPEHIAVLTCAFESIKRLGGPALSIRTEIVP